MIHESDILRNVKFDRNGKVIINEKYYASLGRYDKVSFTTSVKRFMKLKNKSHPLGKILTDVVVDKDNNIIDPNTVSKSVYGAYKAHMTMKAKKDGVLEGDDDKPLKDYHGKNKRAFVKKVTKEFKKYGDGNVLALESHGLLFAKSLPRHMFTIYEKDLRVFKAIEKNMKSVANIKSLIKGDIGKVPYEHFDYAFPDFCNTYKRNEHRVKLLAKRLHDSKVIAFTFSTRGHGFSKRNDGDVQFETIRRLESLFENHIVDYCKTYKDGSPMYGIILKHKDLE